VSSVCTTPSRNDPLSKVASIAHFGGVGLPAIAGCKFPLAIVIRQLRERNGLSFAPDVSHVDISTQSAGRANHRCLVPKLIDRSDDHSAVFALAIGARLPPSVLPDVGVSPTLASHDAAILHGLTSDFNLPRSTDQMHASLAQSRHKFPAPQWPVASEIKVSRTSYCFPPAKRLGDVKPTNEDVPLYELWIRSVVSKAIGDWRELTIDTSVRSLFNSISDCCK
jgi:hypothetical protein